MIVAGLQTDIAWEQPEENYRRARELAATARAGGAELVALPEMFATGFTMDAGLAARAAEAGRSFLAGLARHNGCYVLGGYAEKGPRRPYNACGLFSPDGGEILHYRKLHPFTLAGEDRSYAAGDGLPTADVGGVRVTALICYDLRFAEPFRIAAADTDLFVVIANWPVARAAAWRTLLAARAMENQAYVLGVNRVGEGDGIAYRGDTMLLDPRGEILVSASQEPAAVIGAVHADRVARDRERFGFVADRRPAIYDALARDREPGGRGAPGLITPPDAV